MTEQTPRLYTPAQVAELCSVHVRTVRAWCKVGKLRAIRLPTGSASAGDLRITEAAVREFVGKMDPV